MECPVCRAEMEGDFLCHDEKNFTGEASFFYVCYDCEFCTVVDVPEHKVDYYRKLFGFIVSQNYC